MEGALQRLSGGSPKWTRPSLYCSFEDVDQKESRCCAAGAVAGRRAVALSFPFFSGWNNWTPAEVDAAVATSGRVVQSLWEDWPSAASADHVEVYNVNVRTQYLTHASQYVAQMHAALCCCCAAAVCEICCGPNRCHSANATGAQPMHRK